MPQVYDDISPSVWCINEKADMITANDVPIAVFPEQNIHALGDLSLMINAKSMFKLLLFIREHFDITPDDMEFGYVVWSAHTIINRIEDLYEQLVNGGEDLTQCAEDRNSRAT